MGIALIIIGWLGVVAMGYLTYRFLSVHKKSKATALSNKDTKTGALYLAIVALLGALTNLGYLFAGNWAAGVGHYFLLIIGGTVCYGGLYSFVCNFYLRYWRRDIETQHKAITVAMLVSVAAFLCGFLMAGEGMAPFLTYPLVQGFGIGATGFQWIYPNTSFSGFQVHWYGVLIVGAAIMAYKISDHEFYKKYGKHGILDTCFLIAFPAGILGARIWYVVGNWNGDVGGITPFATRVANGDWLSIFAVWEGGLTILGGAVGGIIGGMTYMLLARKYVDIRFPFDVVVPTILLAQAVGRFGNFFNHEVYGQLTMMSDWPLLPTWIKYNMAVSWTNGVPDFTAITKTVGDVTFTGNMYVPLFLIEALLNVAGYFVITRLIPFLWRKHRPMGANLGFYLIWYGTVRMIMEPLRDANYNMGTNGQWSFWNSMVYIILGVVLLGFFLFIMIYREKKGLPEEYPASAAVLAAQEAGKEAPAVKEEVTSEPVEPPHTDFSKPKPIGKKDDLSKPKPIGKPKDDQPIDTNKEE